MTEEQRVRLEELISEFELYVEEVVLASEEGDLRYARSQREKARDRITDHLTLIQYNNALYNFQRFGVKDLDDLDLREWEKKSPSEGEDCPVCDSWGGKLPGARVHDRDHTRTGSCIYAHDDWVRSQVLQQRKEEEKKEDG